MGHPEIEKKLTQDFETKHQKYGTPRKKLTTSPEHWGDWKMIPFLLKMAPFLGLIDIRSFSGKVSATEKSLDLKDS